MKLTNDTKNKNNAEQNNKTLLFIDRKKKMITVKAIILRRCMGSASLASTFLKRENFQLPGL